MTTYLHRISLELAQFHVKHEVWAIGGDSNGLFTYKKLSPAQRRQYGVLSKYVERASGRKTYNTWVYSQEVDSPSQRHSDKTLYGWASTDSAEYAGCVKSGGHYPTHYHSDQLQRVVAFCGLCGKTLNTNNKGELV